MPLTLMTFLSYWSGDLITSDGVVPALASAIVAKNKHVKFESFFIVKIP
jgi:hypothetical protein